MRFRKPFTKVFRSHHIPFFFQTTLNSSAHFAQIHESLISIAEQDHKIQQNTPLNNNHPPYGDAAFTILMMISCGFALLALYVAVR